MKMRTMRRSTARLRLRSRKLACLAATRLSTPRTAHLPEGRDAPAYLVDSAQQWWDQLVAIKQWSTAAEVGKLCTRRFPKLYFGWENWAWAVHKRGDTGEAYALLAPILKGLKLPGPPSGRAAYCMACFCAVLGRLEEGKGWLRLALLRYPNRAGFSQYAVQEPDLEPLWPVLAELEAAWC